MAKHSSIDRGASETWNYRVIELRHNGETWRGCHEVYYTDGVAHSYTENPVAIAWLVEEGEADGNVMMARLQEALSKPVLTPADFPEARTLSHRMESFVSPEGSKDGLPREL